LYYRLRVVPIHVPPLRERRSDIPILAQHFLAYYWSRHRESGLPLPKFGAVAMEALQAQPWRGNVRELQNVIEHTAVLLTPGAEIRPEDIPFLGDDDPVREHRAIKSDIHQNEYHLARDRVIADFEREYLSWLVGRTAGNMSKAARIAGVDRTTLYRLMEKHGLQRDTVITVRSG
jgi:DNA-binding NtrC family response regulator